MKCGSYGSGFCNGWHCARCNASGPHRDDCWEDWREHWKTCGPTPQQEAVERELDARIHALRAEHFALVRSHIEANRG